MCQRICMKCGNDGADRSLEIWREGLVGIWINGGGIDDFRAVCPDTNDMAVTNAHISAHLNQVNSQLGLRPNITDTNAALLRRFVCLQQGTWMLAYDVERRTLLLGQLADNDTFNAPPHLSDIYDDQVESFKARRITNQRSFRLVDLHEAFLVLPQVGRGTLHGIPSVSRLAQMLVEMDDPREVRAHIHSLPLNDWIDILPPESWESICCGYLILMYGFLPTGLNTGGTLADYDMVGRDLTGKRIFAQCKRHAAPYEVEDQDINAFADLEDAETFFFAYSGINTAGIPGVKHVISRHEIIDWLENHELGKKYRKILLG